MRNLYLVAISLFILSFNSCKKEEAKIEKFTQTDENGNVIGEPNPAHWNLNNFTPVLEEDLEIFFNAEHSIEDDLAHMWINLDQYNQNCNTPNFEFTIFPNPVDLQETENKIYYKLDTDLDILHFYTTGVRNGTIIISSLGNSMPPEGYFYPNYGKDFTLYYVVLTKDSCAFYGKGDIKFK